MVARRPMLFAEENQRLLKQVQDSKQASSLLLSHESDGGGNALTHCQ